MPGFSLIYNLDWKYRDNTETNLKNNLLLGTINGYNYQLNRFVLNQFQKDKLFTETEEHIILLDGVITNSSALIKDSKSIDWKNCVFDLYRKYGSTFFIKFRGSFCGLLYDKKDKKFLIFTDHIGTKPVYYSRNGNGIIISTEMEKLFDIYRSNEIKYDLDIDAVYMLMSYGFMLDDFTISSQIKKLMPGHYIEIYSDKIITKKYYTLPTSLLELDHKTNLSNYIDGLDHNFREAVKRNFNKDVENGYKHLVALSGGLDSRMTSWVGNDLGYKSQLNLTFSQTDYLDETVAKRIAADLKHEWIFKALDNGEFLKAINEITKITGGNLLYSGSAHAYSILKYLNFERMGMLHSGMLGDVIVGSYFSNLRSDFYTIKAEGAYSKRFLDRISYNALQNYPNQEMFLMYQRGFNGINNGLVITNQFVETMSPFYDVDFLEYCFSIPVNIRANHVIYKKWIEIKYPKAGGYVWEKTKRAVNHKPLFNIPFKGRNIPIEDLFQKISTKLGIRASGLSSKNHMNPFDYWYNQNSSLREFQLNYFNDNKHIVKLISENLYNDIEDLFKGTAIEKTQSLSLISTIKEYF